MENPTADHVRRQAGGTRLDFEDGSWLLLRPSGTEPVVRVYAEAATLDRARELVMHGVALVEGV